MTNTHIVASIKEVPIDIIFPNDWNPKESIQDNETNQERYVALKRAIQEHGYNDYIKVRAIGSVYEIVDGFHRFTACRELGFTSLVVLDYGNITREKAIEIGLDTMFIRIEPSTTLTGKLLKNLENQGFDIRAQVFPFDNLEALLKEASTL